MMMLLMRYRLLLYLLLIHLGGVLRTNAQDIQYSQFYANTLALNPAFAGATMNTRFLLANRNQWRYLPGTYRTYAFSADHFINKINSGVGMLATYDQESNSLATTINTFTLGLQYAYQLRLSDNLVYQHGIELGYGSKSLDMGSLTFNNQYTDNGFNGGSHNESLHANKASFWDIGTGGLLYTKQIWAAASLHHLNQPTISFYNASNRLPMKFTLTGGTKFILRAPTEENSKRLNSNKEQSITAAIMYKAQGKSDQTDIGAYYKHHFLIAGLWYRGLPFKLTKPERLNNDAFVILVGLVYNGFWLGYSYDQTISKLNDGLKINSHEITISYQFKHPARQKRFKHVLDCPEF